MSEELPARIAVVHDWLVDYAGSERVLAQILRCLPGADLYALVDHLPEGDRAQLGGRRARTTFLQDLPGVASHLGWYLPLMPLAIEQLDLTEYDLVVSSSHAVAKGVIVSPDALHLCYIHSPMRYAWDRQFEYLQARGPLEWPLRWLLHRLRIWDHRSAAGVDHFAANSAFVARRVKKAYRREAEVLHPPVDTAFFSPGGERGDGYVTAARLVGYKRVDLLVEAFRALPDRRLTVIGDGPEQRRLQAAAASNVRFAGHLPAEALREELRRARAFLFAAVEDFGIAPVEAMACGTPAIAYGRGGAAETVAGLDAPGPTGVLYAERTPAAVAAAVRTFEAHAARITPQACRARAERYSEERFRAAFTEFVAQKHAEWLRSR
jgi:glycosyltransferase involved in cell wall biosynthesis